MNYSPDDRSYYHTEKKNKIILVYPLTRLAEKELMASKKILLPFYRLILSKSTHSKSFEKSLKNDIDSLEKDVFLILNQENISMVQDILEDLFFSKKLDEIGEQEIEQDILLSYKISSFFMKNLLSI